MDEARLQSSYNGAALLYARNQALSYLGKPDRDGHAKVTTFTTDGTNLNMYAHYAAPSEDGTLEYHQYPIKSANLIDSYEGFKEGRRWVRNAQDHAKEQSYALRDQLKEHWKQCRGGLHPIAEGAPLPGAEGIFEATNGDEDEAGYEVVEVPCQPRPRHLLDHAGRQTPSIRRTRSLLWMNTFPVAVARNGKPRHRRPLANPPDTSTRKGAIGSWITRAAITSTNILMVGSLGRMMLIED